MHNLLSELGISREKLVEGLLGAKNCFVFFIRYASMSLGSSLDRVLQSLLNLAEVGVLHEIQKSNRINLSVALLIVFLVAMLFVRRNIARERVNSLLDSLKISRFQKFFLSRAARFTCHFRFEGVEQRAFRVESMLRGEVRAVRTSAVFDRNRADARASSVAVRLAGFVVVAGLSSSDLLSCNRSS